MSSNGVELHFGGGSAHASGKPAEDSQLTPIPHGTALFSGTLLEGGRSGGRRAIRVRHLQPLLRWVSWFAELNVLTQAGVVPLRMGAELSLHHERRPECRHRAETRAGERRRHDADHREGVAI